MRTFLSGLGLALLTNIAYADPLVEEGDRVMLMGDSEAFLLSWEMPARAKTEGVTFDAIPVAGSSVIQWATKLHKERWKIRHWKPDVLLISLGANDACIGAKVVKNEPPYLEKFMAWVDSVGAREVVWLGPPHIGVPPKGRKSLHPQAVEGLVWFAEMIYQHTSVPYFDARSIEVEMWDDQLHCSRKQWPSDKAHGCTDWANWIWDKLLADPDED